MARLLMKNASHIVTCDPSDTVYTDSNLLMEDGVITYIGPEEAGGGGHRRRRLHRLSRPHQHPSPSVPDLQP